MEKIGFIGKDEGNVLHIANGKYRTIVSGKQTSGEYAIIEMIVPPGAGPAPHAHKDIEEVFYLASGEVEFRWDEGQFKATAGDTIRIPRGGAVHAFKNTSTTNAMLICTVHPSGLEEMFAEIEVSDPSHAQTIIEKFGNQLYPNDYFVKK